MSHLNVAFGACAAMSSAKDLEDVQLMIAALDEQIGQVGPAMAFQLMTQKRALEDQLRARKRMLEAQALAEEVEEDNCIAQANAAAMHLSRRAVIMISAF